jgi:hypothetical protein
MLVGSSSDFIRALPRDVCYRHARADSPHVAGPRRRRRAVAKPVAAAGSGVAGDGKPLFVLT